MIKKLFLIIGVCSLWLMATVYASAEERLIYTEGELISGVQSFVEIPFASQGYSYKMNKICLKDHYYLVVGEVEANPKNDHPYHYQSYPYLALYENDKLKWSKIASELGYGIFVDALFEENGIVVLGSTESTQNVSSLLLMKYDFNGNTINTYKLEGDSNTFVANIFKYKKEYYITGQTHASNLEKSKTIYDNNGFIYVLKVSESLKFLEIGYFGNSEVNIIYQSIMIDDVIYMYIRMTGEGYFNVGYHGYVLLSVNTYLEKDSYVALTLTGKILLRNCFGKPTIFDYRYLSDELTIYEYDATLTLLMKKAMNLNFLSYTLLTYDVDYYQNEDKQIVLLMDISRIGNGYRLQNIFFDQDYNQVFSIRGVLEEDSIYNICKFHDGYIHLFGLRTESGKTQIYGDKMAYLKLSKGDCYINGVLASKAIGAIEAPTFGIYQGDVYYSLGKIKITAHSSIVVPPIVSVSSGEIYDLGHKLTFNGTGYLNNKEIDDGYIIKIQGSYILEVKGKDGSVYYTFDVLNLCVTMSQEREATPIFFSNIDASENGHDNSHISSINYTTISHNNSNKEAAFDYSIVIILGFIGLVAGILIPRRKNHA